MYKVRDINEDMFNQNDELLVRMFIFGNSKFSTNFQNTEILNSLNEYMLATKSFGLLLLQNDYLLNLFNFFCKCLIYIQKSNNDNILPINNQLNC